MTLMTVPIIDIAPYWTGAEVRKRAVAQKIDEACRDIGFLVIAGHGVSADLIQAIDDVSREFFDLPLRRRCRWSAPRRTSRVATSPWKVKVSPAAEASMMLLET